jgi:hypothetical protein
MRYDATAHTHTHTHTHFPYLLPPCFRKNWLATLDHLKQHACYPTAAPQQHHCNATVTPPQRYSHVAPQAFNINTNKLDMDLLTLSKALLEQVMIRRLKY